MLQLGYEPVDDILEQDLLHYHYHLNLKKHMLLEIHWKLSKRYFQAASDFWWESSTSLVWHNIRIAALSDENLILYLVFRLFDHCFFPYKFFVVLAAVIENAPDLNWNRLMKRAEACKMTKLVNYTLSIVNEFMSVNTAHAISPPDSFSYSCFKRLVLSGIFHGIKNKHFRMMLYTLIFIPPADAVLIMGRRLFPPEGELRLRYELPDKPFQIYLFYFLNPFLLFFAWLQRKPNA